MEIIIITRELCKAGCSVCINSAETRQYFLNINHGGCNIQS